MSKLLTLSEYRDLAFKLVLPVHAYINGQFVTALSGKTMPTVNPATGAVLAQVAACNEDDVNVAVANAKSTFATGSWANMHPTERKKIMLKFTDLIGKNSRQLAVMESLESGKPIRECELVDLPETIHCIEWHAEAADKIYDQLSPSGNNAVGLIVREPIGVVACVLPWNFPLMMVAWKLGPALAMGNSVVIKPAEQTSMTTLRLAELAFEAGIPAGVINVVPGYGHEAGQALGLHNDVQMVSFTGSTEIGRKFLEFSAQSNLKKIVLECGGKNPSVVLDDAENLASVAQHIVYAALWNMGQNCTANSRVIVHKRVKAELTAMILKEMEEWHTGDPLDPSNALGAIISQEHYDKICHYISIGKVEGGTLLTGGEPIVMGDGLFVSPTLFDDVTPGMTIAREEIFGPVFAIITANSNEQALEIANDTCYGLHASLYTSSGINAQRFARKLQAGTVSINCYSEGDISTPFGGYKLSGFGGRDNSLQAHDQYSETKTIWLDISQ
jgi:gamma-glutamyl-gamma-aminobutyraldehyde dehydrogenase